MSCNGEVQLRNYLLCAQRSVGAGCISLARVGGCVRVVCGCTGYLRSALDTQRAHLIHSHVAHVHALAVNLHAAALEVLLVVHTHLESGGEKGMIVGVTTEIKEVVTNLIPLS